MSDLIRNEVASYIRSNIGALAESTHRAYLAYLSLDDTYTDWRENGVQWSRDQLLAVANALETDDASSFSYDFFVGVFIPKASPEYFGLFNFLECTSFTARQIIAGLMDEYISQTAFLREALQCVEAFFLRIVSENLRLFSERGIAPGTIIQQVRPLFPSKPDTAIETGDTASEPEIVLVPATPRRPDALSGLTTRENQVACLVASGFSNKDIAQKLGLSLATVKHHVSNALSKLGLANRTELALLVNSTKS